MDVSIVIVSFKVKDFLKICLTSIYKETQDLDFEIFVVDNDSKDGSVEMVENEFPQVNLVANSKNLGFAKACNQAIKKSCGKYILLLNPDTRVADNAIKKTWQFMERANKSGIAGCKVLNDDGSLQPSIRRFPDLLSHILILLKLHNFFPNLKSLRQYYHTDFYYNKSDTVDQIMGAYFMVRRSMLKQIGLLDEHFYIWYEEVDLCKRAQNKKWQVNYFAETFIYHQKGLSFSRRSALAKQLIYNRSLLYYFFKHHSVLEYIILLFLYPVSILLTAIIQIFGIRKKKKKH